MIHKKKKSTENPTIIGTIELDYAPLACHSCGKILVNTYVRKGDPDRAKPLHVLCNQCYDKVRCAVAWAESKAIKE